MKPYREDDCWRHEERRCPKCGTKLDNAMGHEITYDWTHHGPVFRSGLERVAEVAEDEANGVRQADFVVVLWPGGRGTHVELGLALGLEKSVIFISDVEAHHEATQETCAFYHHPLVRRFRTTDDASRFFISGPPPPPVINVGSDKTVGPGEIPPPKEAP